MNEQQFGNRIRHLLNRGLELDPAKLERLREAREHALERQRPEPVPALRWADNVFGSFDGWRGVSTRVLLPVAVLVLAVSGIYTWQDKRRVAELVDIDSQLLTDDLPVDAYFDRGFQNWLKTQSQGRATDYQVQVTARVSLKTVPDGKVLWENPAYTFRDNYSYAATAASYVDLENDAIDRVAGRFAQALVTSLLEGF